MFSARRLTFLLALLLLAAGAVLSQESPVPDRTLDMTVSPMEATIGDHIKVELALTVPEEALFHPENIDDRFEPLAVLRSEWTEMSDPTVDDGRKTWVWNGTIAAYETGEMELQPISLVVEIGGEKTHLATDAVEIRIRSVLSPPDKSGDLPEIAEIKPPASLEPEYGRLWIALLCVLAIVAAAASLWWLHRRYARRLSAVPQPADPFNRMPPHDWAYQELKRLLDSGPGEGDDVDIFYSELARILKQYLSGRYRADLMEHTTEEVPFFLNQAGAPEREIETAQRFLESCDLVKFARNQPSPEECRSSVEEAYRIVDSTRPVESPDRAGERGAA